MQFLRQSTSVTILVGPVLDADGVAYTSAVIGDFNATKNGSTAALAAAATATHSHNGMYLLALTTGNTDTLGRLDISMNKATYAMTNHRFDVIAAQVYDSLVSGSDLLQIDIQQLVGSAQDASRILIGATAQHEVAVTGSNHVAADVHEFQPGVITAGDFAAGAIDATVLATDSIGSSQIAASAVTEIQSGLATSSGVTSAFTEIKGATWSSSTDTLEAIRDASGSVTVNVTPLQATEPDRITPSGIQTLINDLSAIGPIAIKDSSGDPVSLAGLTLKVCIERIDGTVLANLTPTISGASNNQITFTPNADSVAKTGTFRWALRQVSDGKVYGLGEFIVDSAAKIAP